MFSFSSNTFSITFSITSYIFGAHLLVIEEIWCTMILWPILMGACNPGRGIWECGGGGGGGERGPVSLAG